MPSYPNWASFSTSFIASPLAAMMLASWFAMPKTIQGSLAIEESARSDARSTLMD
jgi:hypothetical protein